MSLTIAQWHARFSQQAAWTKQLRTYLYNQIGLDSNARVLEVGCGTGVLSDDFAGFKQITYFGLDIDLPRLGFAAAHHSTKSSFLNADAYSLPFPDGSFDLVFTHYLFLWLADPQAALDEMVRVTRSLGSVLALAEPDYGSRIDEPSSLAALGSTQVEALQAQGVHPLTGRTLPHLFSQAGLVQIQFGSSGFQTHVGLLPQDFELEWQILEEDLRGSFKAAELTAYRNLDREAWLDGSRVLWVPTFYAMGTKDPKSHANNH